MIIPMKSLFPLLCALALSVSKAVAADSGIDPQGYIRDWVMLAPIPLPEGPPAGDLLLRDQVPDEASLKPKDGDKVRIRDRELVWRNVTAKTNYVDINAALESIYDRSAGYLVAYVECSEEIPNVMMSVASNDQGRIYFNGKDIYAFTEARTLMLDGDKGKVTLKQGVNVIVFKIINEQNSWQGAMRLTDLAGKPLKNVRVRRTPTPAP